MPDEKITIQICSGPTCYMLGAGRLLKLEAGLPEAWREKVEITIYPCAKECEMENLGGAPFVRINGETLSGATRETIHARIFRILEECRK